MSSRFCWGRPRLHKVALALKVPGSLSSFAMKSSDLVTCSQARCDRPVARIPKESLGQQQVHFGKTSLRRDKVMQDTSARAVEQTIMRGNPARTRTGQRGQTTTLNHRKLQRPTFSNDLGDTAPLFVPQPKPHEMFNPLIHQRGYHREGPKRLLRLPGPGSAELLPLASNGYLYMAAAIEQQ